MLKVVIDTNVFVSGYLSKSKMGCSSQIISLWRSGKFTLVMSPQILIEIVAKLLEKNIDETLVEELLSTMATSALHIPGAYQSTKLDAVDSSDNMFLAAAYESNAEFIISLDKKSLLPLKHFHGSQIVRPELFVRQFYDLSADDDFSGISENFSAYQSKRFAHKRRKMRA